MILPEITSCPSGKGAAKLCPSSNVIEFPYLKYIDPMAAIEPLLSVRQELENAVQELAVITSLVKELHDIAKILRDSFGLSNREPDAEQMSSREP